MFYIIPVPSKSLYKLLDCVQRLIEIGDDVIDMLSADGQADRVAADAYIGKLRIGELAVGRGGRVDYKALDIGDIGQQREDLQMIDELEGLLLAALNVEGEDRCAAVGEVLLIQGVIGVIGQAGVVDLLHLGVVGQELDDLLVFSLWRSRRRESVSVPCSSTHALNGLMQPPRSRRITART